MGYAWKKLHMYFKNCVSWSPFIILNFNTICDVQFQCAVQIESYTVLLKNNRMFCLTLGITLRNYFLTVSNKGDDHLWLYFAYFLNYSQMSREVDC